MHLAIVLLIFVVLLVLFIAAVLASIYIRNRRAGLAAPSWRSCLPFTSAAGGYHGAGSGGGGGTTRWVKDRSSKLGNTRTQRGVYEDVGGSGSGSRGRGRGRGGARYGRANDLEDACHAGMGADTPANAAGSSGGAGPDQELGRRYQRYYRKTSSGTTTDKPRSGEEGERGEQNRGSDPSPRVTTPDLGDSSTNTDLENPFGDHAESRSLKDVTSRPEGSEDATTRTAS